MRKQILRKYALLFLLAVFAPACGLAETGSELVRHYFDINGDAKLSDMVVRDAVLRVVPVGTEINEVIKKLSARGLSHPYWPNNAAGHRICFPDKTPITCHFRSPKGDQYKDEPNWAIEFAFDKDNKLEDVDVRHWVRVRK